MVGHVLEQQDERSENHVQRDPGQHDGRRREPPDGSRERVDQVELVVRLLDRDLESLPSEDEIDARRKAGTGLTRPELAVIMSYAKIELYSNLMETDAPEDPYLSTELESYFPTRLRRRFAPGIRTHRLRREIIAMGLSNSMINRMGAPFAIRAEEDTGSSIAQVARAYAIAREIFDVRVLWKEIESCDNQVPAEVQYDLLFQISRRLRHAVYWLLQRRPDAQPIDQAIPRFSSGVRQVQKSMLQLEGAAGSQRESLGQLKRLGIPFELVTDSSCGSLMTQGRVDRIVVGADRIAANGDAANKIGTYSHAVSARHHGIPFYVAAPRSTFDLSLASGAEDSGFRAFWIFVSFFLLMQARCSSGSAPGRNSPRRNASRGVNRWLRHRRFARATMRKYSTPPGRASFRHNRAMSESL